MSILEFVRLFPKALKEWLHDRSDGLSASIAFYQLMSIAPFIALLFVTASVFLNDNKKIVSLISQFIHPQFLTAIKFMLSYSVKLDENKLFAVSALAIISLVHGTISYFAQLKDAVETFWNLRTEKITIKERLIKIKDSLLMALVIFVILMGGSVVCYLIPVYPIFPFFFIKTLIESFVVFLIIFFVFTYCPPVKIKWIDVIPAAILTTLLYMVGRVILAFILKKQESQAENVAAALIMYLLWSYYSSMIILYGSEFCKVYIEKKRGIEVNKLTYS